MSALKLGKIKLFQLRNLVYFQLISNLDYSEKPQVIIILHINQLTNELSLPVVVIYMYIFIILSVIVYMNIST